MSPRAVSARRVSARRVSEQSAAARAELEAERARGADAAAAARAESDAARDAALRDAARDSRAKLEASEAERAVLARDVPRPRTRRRVGARARHLACRLGLGRTGGERLGFVHARRKRAAQQVGPSGSRRRSPMGWAPAISPALVE